MTSLDDIKNLVSDYTAENFEERIIAVKFSLMEIMKKPFIFDNSKMAVIVSDKHQINVCSDDIRIARDIFRSCIDLG